MVRINWKELSTKTGLFLAGIGLSFLMFISTALAITGVVYALTSYYWYYNFELIYLGLVPTGILCYVFYKANKKQLLAGLIAGTLAWSVWMWIVIVQSGIVQ